VQRRRRRSQRFWFLSTPCDTVATHIHRQAECLLTTPLRPSERLQTGRPAPLFPGLGDGLGRVPSVRFNPLEALSRPRISRCVESYGTPARVGRQHRSYYEAAGGAVIRDLFAECGDEVFLTDAALLDRLFAERIEAVLEPVRAEGWKEGAVCAGRLLLDIGKVPWPHPSIHGPHAQSAASWTVTIGLSASPFRDRTNAWPRDCPAHGRAPQPILLRFAGTPQ
jgi:hypothetical protein